MWGFQLWVNLPRTDKMTAPRYQDIQGDRIPEVGVGPGARARVLVGTVNGVAGPVTDVATEPVYVDLHLDAGASYDVEVREGHNVFAYVYAGDAKIGAAGVDRPRRVGADLGRREAARSRPVPKARG